VAEWKGGGWSEPAVAPFSGRYSDADLSFSPAGDEAYLVSTRPTKPGGPPRPDTEIWRMRLRAGSSFGEPEHVYELSSDGNEWFPNATADGWLYFGSERREGNRGDRGTSDLWRARIGGSRYGVPENLGPRLNTAGNDIEPWVSADGRLMILASNGRPDTRGAYTDRPLERALDFRALLAKIRSPGNGLRDIYHVEMASLDLGPECGEPPRISGRPGEPLT
jgi:hypothetical protein